MIDESNVGLHVIIDLLVWCKFSERSNAKDE